MWFDNAMLPVFRVMQQVCQSRNIKCVRADTDAAAGRVSSHIYRQILGADVIIADMTGLRPNVLYEIGLAHAITERVILLTQDTATVPFDLQDFRHIKYNMSAWDGKDELVKALSEHLDALLAQGAGGGASQASAPPRAEPSSQDDGVLDTDDPGLLHVLGEVERKQGKRGKYRQIMERALKLAREGKGSAAAVGNCAIEAEAGSLYDLADDLYKAALERNPTHVNNTQCYVSFILDHRNSDSKRVEEAAKKLVWLDTVPERKERTRALKSQLELLRNPSARGTGVAGDQIAALKAKASVRIHDVVPLLAVATSAKDTGLMDEIVNAALPKMPANQQWMLRRVHADHLASTDDREDEAISIYEDLIAKGLADASLCSNLAVLYSSPRRPDKHRRACELFLAAYAKDPGEDMTRKAFVTFLLKRGKPDDAKTVIEGKPLATVRMGADEIRGGAVVVRSSEEMRASLMDE